MTDKLFRINFTIPKNIGVDTHWGDDGSVVLTLSSGDPDALAQVGPESHRFSKEADLMILVAMWGRTMLYVLSEGCPKNVEDQGRKLVTMFEAMIRRNILLLDPNVEACYATGGALGEGFEAKAKEVKELEKISSHIDAAEMQGKFQKSMAEAIDKGWKIKAPANGTTAASWVYGKMIAMNTLAFEAGNSYAKGLEVLLDDMPSNFLSDPEAIAKLRSGS